MQSVIIITAAPLDLDAIIAGARRIGVIELHSQVQLAVKGDWGHFILDVYDSIADDYEPEALQRVRTLIREPHFAQLMYREAAALDQGVLLLPECWIDNDHGLLAPIEDIRARIARGEDWRRATQ